MKVNDECIRFNNNEFKLVRWFVSYGVVVASYVDGKVAHLNKIIYRLQLARWWSSKLTIKFTVTIIDHDGKKRIKLNVLTLICHKICVFWSLNVININFFIHKTSFFLQFVFSFSFLSHWNALFFSSLVCNLHLGERPYKCHLPDCGRAFIQLSNLQQHLRNHDAQVERAKNRPFHCNICGKGFATESSLRTHTSKVSWMQ